MKTNLNKDNDYFYEDYRMADFYDDHYRDVTHDIPFWLDESIRSEKILEVACGTGRITLPLLVKGKTVTGVDFSQEMLDILAMDNSKNSKLSIVNSDMRTMELNDKFDLIFITSNSLNHIETNGDLEKTLITMYKHLNDDGKLIFDVLNPKFEFLLRDKDGEYGTEVLPHTKTGGFFKTWENNTYDYKSQINNVTYYYQMCDESGQSIEDGIAKMKLKVRLFFPAEIDYMIDKAGFKVDHKYDWYDKRPWEGNTSEQIFVLSKK